MALTFTDPSSNIRDEIATSSGMPELPEKIWFHKTAAAVIDADRCVGCGGCIAACPSRSIGVGEDGKPTLVKMCTGCSACWDYCPLAGLRVERLTKLLDERSAEEVAEVPEVLGTVRASYSVKAIRRAEKAQDGGVVSGLLEALLRSQEIDGVILSQRQDAFHGRSFLATSAEEVRAAAGSVYHQSHALSVLNQPLPDDVERLAFVGTPCQISVLRALQRFPWQYRSTAAGAVVLTIALFCTKSFDPDRLESAVQEKGVDTDSISRIDIREGQLIAQDGGGAELLRSPVKEFSGAALQGCDECMDFSGLNSDLSVGNVGSDPGYSTVLVRSEAGAKAIEAVRDSLSIRELRELGPVSRIAGLDAKRAKRTSARGIDPEGSLWISYSEHLKHYSGTDRTPKAPPGYRSYHFDVSC